MPANFLSAIDQSMVPVALLTIGSDLGDLTWIAWVMSGYLVAGTVATPIYGKLSDLHGRRRMLLAAIVLACLGSLTCSLAVSMPMLVAARVLQGLGSGAIFALAQAAVADVVSGPERARFQAYFSGVFATSALVAPVMGGLLTQYLSWRAIFWVNLPIAALSWWCIYKVLPTHTRGTGPRVSIDWMGAAWLTAGLGLGLIALTRVGQGAGWLGSSTLLLAGSSALLLTGWVKRKPGKAQPIVPLALFRNGTVAGCCAITACTFFVLTGCSVLLPLAMQTVGEARTDQVAFRLIALTLAVPVGAFTGGQIMLRTKRLRELSAVGSLLSCGALAGLAFFMPKAGPGLAALMVPLGLGIGVTLPIMTVLAQMAVEPRQTGITTATVSFFRSLGSVIGIAVLTSLVLSAAAGTVITKTDPAVLRSAFTWAFALASLSALIAAALAMRLPLPPSLIGRNH
jgi:MFS family permease